MSENDFDNDIAEWIINSFHHTLDVEILRFTHFAKSCGIEAEKKNEKADCWLACSAIYAATYILKEAYKVDIQRMNWNAFNRNMTIRMFGDSSHATDAMGLRLLEKVENIANECLKSRPINFNPLIAYLVSCGMNPNQSDGQGLLYYFLKEAPKTKSTVLAGLRAMDMHVYG